MINCEGLAEINLHQSQQSRIVLPSPLALPFRIALLCLLVSAALLQGAYSQTETHMHGQRVHHKIASSIILFGTPSSVWLPLPPGNGQNGMMRAGFSFELGIGITCQKGLGYPRSLTGCAPRLCGHEDFGEDFD